MEIKYTLEILTKDIQDIGKLVENLHNSPDGSTLELDLALSKLRNVYDILNEIRTDIFTQGQLHRRAPQLISPPPAVPHPREENDLSRPGSLADRPQAQATPQTVKEPEQASENPIAENPAQLEQTPFAETKEEAPKVKDSRIIAEKFMAESSINENMAGNREQDMETKVVGPPIDSIGRNIGINDRFLIIRELFDGDSDGFGKLISDLDTAGSMKAASERLSAQFKSTPNHEGVAILGNLVKRRFSHS